ncbi:MAG: 3-phosphoglycerate dehydrogenase [Bacteroidales bacterium]|nr:3-phosphoglycerate dehydrogenase [Bacteroidales bacterium]
MKKVLVATEKPFAPVAVNGIKTVLDEAGYEMILLEKYTSVDEFKAAAAKADAMIIRSDQATREVIEAAPSVKIIVRAGAGYDNIDLQACNDKGVVAMNTPGQNSNAVAELAFAMMLYSIRGAFSGASGTELRGKSIGIHAYGNVGKYVAEIAKGFGMKIYAFDPFVKKEDIEKDGLTALDSVEELYKTCQYISLHIPANDKTKKSINYDLLKQMPKKGMLVNTARKEVIDEEGLLKFMEEREDIRYVSDIAPDTRADFEAKFPGRVVFTAKKMGAQTSEANINAGIAAAKQIVAFFEKGDVTFKVNK